MNTPEDTLGCLADGDVSLSVQRVLRGYIEEMGGPESLGRAMAQMTKDEDVTIASRVALVNNMTKLLGVYGGQEQADDLIDDEQVSAIEQRMRDWGPSDD